MADSFGSDASNASNASTDSVGSDIPTDSVGSDASNASTDSVGSDASNASTDSVGSDTPTDSVGSDASNPLVQEIKSLLKEDPKMDTLFQRLTKRLQKRRLNAYSKKDMKQALGHIFSVNVRGKSFEERIDECVKAGDNSGIMLYKLLTEGFTFSRRQMKDAVISEYLRVFRKTEVPKNETLDMVMKSLFTYHNMEVVKP